MRATPNCLARGFWGRSVDEFVRYAKFVWRVEAMNRPTTPFILKSMHQPDCIEGLKLMSDKAIGGFSKSAMDWVPPVTGKPSPTENSHGYIRWYGDISLKLPPDRPKVHRSGYAAFRTRDRGFTIFGKSRWDMDNYYYLGLRVKSDGRKYFVNLQSETVVPTDIHQHRLHARKPGEWETILINWNEFVRTNHGAVVEPQNELQRNKLLSVGISLIDRVPGRFELCVDRIFASNGLTKEELAEDGRVDKSKLKSTSGEKLSWSE